MITAVTIFHLFLKPPNRQIIQNATNLRDSQVYAGRISGTEDLKQASFKPCILRKLLNYLFLGLQACTN